MNKDTLQKIAEEAFVDELEKISGKKSEVASTGLVVGSGLGAATMTHAMSKHLPGYSDIYNDIKGPLGAVGRFSLKHPWKYAGAGIAAGVGIPAAIGLARKAQSKEEKEKQNKKTVSNFLIPYASSYRLGRRIKSAMSKKDKD